MFRHTLHMENPSTPEGQENLRAMLDLHFPTGYTLLEGDGSYAGMRESCAIVMLISDKDMGLTITAFCAAYKAAWDQQTVLQTTDLVSVTWR